MSAAPLSKGKPWAATKLQILLPGEVAKPNTVTGKDPLYPPTPLTAGQQFTVRVNAVNKDWSVDTTQNDMVAITASGAATLPSNAALVNGTKTFTVTFTGSGTGRTVTATDAEPGTTIIPNTSTAVAVNAAATAFVKLQILLPGEEAMPGSATGKNPAKPPNAQTVGVPFPVVVNAVDANWNVKTSVDAVGLVLSAANVVAPMANRDLVAGTTTFQVTFTAAGVFTIQAVDADDNTKTANTSPDLTVNQPTIATTPILDDFNRANEDPLSGAGRWAALGASGAASNLKVVSNQLAANAGGNAVTAASYGPNCEVYATIGASTGGFGLNLRIGNIGASFTGYGLSSNGLVQSIVKFGPGGGTLGASFGDPPQAGDTFLFRAVGSTLTVHRLRGGTWTLLATRTDPTSPILSAGRIGVSIHSDSLSGRIDNVGGGTTAASSAYSKLKVTAPGAATVGVAVNVTVEAVDANDVLQSTVTNRVTLAGGSASVPASPAALVGGTKTFQVTFPAAGTFTLAAADIDDITKAAGQSAPITVTDAPIVMPPVLFADGFWNQNHAAWIGGAGGRAAACDCTTVCPGGTPNKSDPQDSYIANPSGGFFRRTTIRPTCKSLNASCLNACELIKDWGSYKLGQSEFLAHRCRVTAPYTGQVGFCVISQFGYCQVKFNGLGLNLLGNTLQMYCNLGYSAPAGGASYTNPQGYEPRGGDHPVAVGEWHDYIWELTYSTIFGTAGGTKPPGKLKLWHRKPDTSLTWAVIFDSAVSMSGVPAGVNPALGVPTRQWGYGLQSDTQLFVDVNGIQLFNDGVGTAGQPRKAVDKMGAYRGAGNNNNLTVDHRKFCVAATFANAEAYLNWPG